MYQIDLAAYEEGFSKEDDGPEAQNKISVLGICISLFRWRGGGRCHI